jgi:hypothetical protein
VAHGAGGFVGGAARAARRDLASVPDGKRGASTPAPACNTAAAQAASSAMAPASMAVRKR